MSERAFLLELSALDASDQPVTLRYADAPHIDAGDNYYDVRLQQPARYKVKASGAVVPGSGRGSFGEALLVNPDGGLDGLADYAVDGRALALSLRNEDGSISPILNATCAGLGFDGNRISVRLRDAYEALQSPHPQNLYGGTNALPSGVDGVATDIKGKPIPKVFGRVRNAAPVLVNTARYIYQLHGGAQSVVSAVYDRGVALTNGGAYPDLATLQSTPPTAGQYRAFNGYFRVGTTPSGQITCDADAPVTALGSVFAQIAAEAGYTVNAADVTVMDAVGDVGIYLADRRDTTALLDLLANSAGGAWCMDSSGVIRLRQLLAPASPTLSINDYQIISLSRSALGAGSNGLPVWRVALNADRAETVQNDLAGSVPAATAARLAQQTRQAVAESAATKTRNPLAAELAIETALRNLADAQTQANRLRDLLSVRRDTLQAEVRLDAETAALIQIGAVVTLMTPKFGYSAGRNLLVLGYELDARLSRVTLDLWG